MKTQFYFSEKSIQFIICAATFFGTSPINTQQAFTTFYGFSTSIYQPLYYSSSPTNQNPELLFLNVFDEAVKLPFGNVPVEYFTVSFCLPKWLVESNLPSSLINIFYQINMPLPNNNN